MIRIPKRFKGHAAFILRALLRHYKPASKVDVISRVYDPTDDGPEIELIRFFQRYKQGIAKGRI